MDNFLDNSSEWLIRYIDGELQGEDKLRMEKELENNAVLKSEFDSLLVAKESIRMFGLAQQVAGIHNEMMSERRTGRTDPSKKATVRQLLRYGLLAAASILVLLVGIKTFRYFNLSADSLFKEQYHVYELGSLRGFDTTQHSAIEQAYRNKEYQQVILLSQKSDPAGIKEEFLEGISFLETGDVQEGIKKFSVVLELTKDSSENIFKDAAEYYLSLSYLKNKEYDKALEIMRSIKADPRHLYRDKITDSFTRQVERLK
ncbi:MAG: tetratricopeptide repeat protein [Chitinophagaceae bacterium]|nr:tetratricopeptide repeat protein [Chitinophagaceae bacterium]